MSSDAAYIAFLSAILAATLTQALIWLREFLTASKSLRADRVYTSLRIATILESFAVACAEQISASELHHDSSGAAGNKKGTLPEFPQYPSDINWKSLDADIADKALSLPMKINLSNKKTSTLWEVTADHDDVAREVTNQCGKCGYHAWLTASVLRERSDISQSRLREFSWDFVDKLRERSEVCEKSERAATRYG
ncbi:MAG: hypothetical protein JHC88_08300 [Niveispirillum sp.]|nr:hypothetical protein [Niveispirillum sp.]